MTKKPLVSVIIPNYNHAQYLDKRLQSVLGQTYTNFEVIILDDKSTDNSLEVIAKYQDNPHVSQVVVNEVNSGSTFKQWDKGISLAKGEIIWIAESDDYCELNLLEELVKACSAKPNVVVAFCQYILDYGEFIYKEKEHVTNYYNGKNFICNRMVRFCEIRNASGAIFLKSAYSHISKEYLNYKSCGDMRFWIEILAQGTCAKVGRNLTYFRQSRSSVTGGNDRLGIVQLETREICNYVEKVWGLSMWQMNLMYKCKAKAYSVMEYKDDQTKQKVFSAWNIKTDYKDNGLYRWLFWIIGTIERHLHILI